MAIAFYITSHGFGHAARSLEVIRALVREHPVTVVSLVPEAFLRRALGPEVAIRPCAFDCGMVQIDSVRTDLQATLAAVRELMARAPEMLAQELDFFRQAGVRLVAVDAPALPLEAAWRSGLPGLAVTSFGWDFIYQRYLDHDTAWSEVCAWFAQGYSRASHLLRYPFSEPMAAIASREDVPLVARPGRERRREIAERTGADPSRPWALLWFHQLDLEPDAPERLEQLPYELLTSLPLPWQARNLRSSDCRFADLVASVDVVISKPGFGILSDCVANHKPLVYAPRHDFRESELLARAARQYLRHRPIPQEDLYAGRWLEHLEAARTAAEPPDTLPVNGADQIAERILSFL